MEELYLFYLGRIIVKHQLPSIRDTFFMEQLTSFSAANPLPT